MKRSEIKHTEDGRPYNTGQPWTTTVADIGGILLFIVALTFIGVLLS